MAELLSQQCVFSASGASVSHSRPDLDPRFSLAKAGELEKEIWRTI